MASPPDSNPLLEIQFPIPFDRIRAQHVEPAIRQLVDLFPPPERMRLFSTLRSSEFRPGEEVHFKGWLRLIGGGQTGDVGLVGGKVNGVSYQITDSQGNQLSITGVPVNLSQLSKTADSDSGKKGT